MEGSLQNLTIRAFAHVCVALDYFVDPVEQVPDAQSGGFVDDLQFMVRTEQRFHRELVKYREWRNQIGQPV